MYTRKLIATLLVGGLSLSITSLSALADSPAIPNNSTWLRPTDNSKLIHFVRSAVEANPQVLAASSAVSASSAFEAAAARPLYNPELEIGGENTDVNTRTLGISQTIDWGGKRAARTAVAAADYLAVQADYQRVRQRITTQLLAALAAYQTGVERDGLATERVALMQQFAELATERFDAGDLSQVEYNLATLVFADANMLRATTAAALADTRQQVENLIAMGGSTPWPTLDTALPTLPAQHNTTALLAALPALQAAQRRVDSARAMVTLKKREQRLDPTLSFTGGDEDGERLVGLSLSIPLPVRNRFSHEVKAASAQYSQTQQSADDLRQRAHSRLTNASQRYQIAHTAWQLWQQIGQANLRQQGDQLRRLWEANELSTTEYLVQIDQTIDSRDNALTLRLSLWQAWFERLAAAAQVDQWLGSDRSTTNTH